MPVPKRLPYTIREKMDIKHPDFIEFLKCAQKHDLRYLCIGGYAVNFFGHYRYTDDMDIWIAPTDANKRSLLTYASLLEDCHFIRVHKSYVVNLEHIKEYIHGDGGSVVLTGNKMVEVSRRKRDILLDKMRQHFRY